MTQANPPTTPISTSKSAALSRVLDLVPKGYTRYAAGRCPARKAKALAQKFHEKYGVGCSPAQRITRKQKGLANAVLVLYWPACGEADGAAGEVLISPLNPSPDRHPILPDAEVVWLLLVTAGNGAVVEEELLASVLDARRLVWLGYELVRQPNRGGSRWTWRRTKAEMADWYALLGDQLAARRMGALAETLQLISRQPGFSGVREQSWALCQFVRQRGYTGELPFLFHMQKIGHGVPLRLV